VISADADYGKLPSRFPPTPHDKALELLVFVFSFAFSPMPRRSSVTKNFEMRLALPPKLWQ
jgi:hypothetical protein